MKSTFKSRNLATALLVITGLAIGTVSCKKDSSSTSSTTVSTDDAADAITQAVSPASNGLVAQTQTATVTASTVSSSAGNTGSIGTTSTGTVAPSGTGSFECGVESDTTYSGQNPSGTAITYSYSFSFSRLLTCDNGVPQQFAFDYSGKTSYDAPRISSADSAQAQFTITGLQPASSQYTFNQTYLRKGSEQSKIGNDASFNSTISITTSNLIVDKSSQQILSGTASVSISGATSGGKSFSYSGTITFQGNKQALLDLGNGNTYTITWS